MTTIALLGLDLILGLIAVALWAYAAVRAQTFGLRWAMAGLLVVLVRLVTVLILADRGWELAAERVTVGVPLALLAGTAALGLLIHARRRSRTGSTAARTALWCAAGASAVSLVLTGVVGYPGWPGAAGHNHSHSGGVAVTDLRTPPIGAARKVELVAQTQAVTLPSGRVVDAWTFGSLPGPTLTARLGETLEVTLRNRDITGGVTLHWHGLSVPNGEDGVAGVTQNAVFPGDSFVYRFRAEQPGTFWYHTHQHGREGIARGLYGALVVQPASGSTAGVDLVLPFHTIGKTAILGGSDQVQRKVVAAGTPVRLRLVNTEQQPRLFALTGAAFRVVALDGVDLNGPTEVSNQALRVPAGGRYDIAFPMPASPVRLSVEGARQAGLVLAASTDAPEPEASQPTTTFDPTTYGTPKPVPEMTGEFDGVDHDRAGSATAHPERPACSGPDGQRRRLPRRPASSGDRRRPAPDAGGEPQLRDPPDAPARAPRPGAERQRTGPNRRPALAGHLRRATRRSLGGRPTRRQPRHLDGPLPQPRARGRGHDVPPRVRRGQHALHPRPRQPQHHRVANAPGLSSNQGRVISGAFGWSGGGGSRCSPGRA